MKKWLPCFAMLVLLAAGSVLTVYAETNEAEKNWNVVFTKEEKMESDFQSGMLSEEAGGMQPGDSKDMRISLKNEADYATDWYMTNEILSSLENSQSVASGGVYTYRLVYTSSTGEESVLFDSDSVGGEKNSPAGVGLHEATDSLEEFLYLERLEPGGTGSVTLTVALDGETQTNTYQNTQAALQINFAVEKAADDTPFITTTPNTPDSPSAPGTPVDRTPGPNIVRTGDNGNMMLWSLLALGSGMLLLFVAITKYNRDKKRGKGA